MQRIVPERSAPERAEYSSGIILRGQCRIPGGSGGFPGALKRGVRVVLFGQAAGRYWLMSPLQVVVR